MGSLRHRYPRQQLRASNLSDTNGHTNGYAESEDEEFPSRQPSTTKSARGNSFKRRSYPLQHLSTDQLKQQRQQGAVLEDDEPEPEEYQMSHSTPPEQHGSMRRRYPAQRVYGQPQHQSNGFHHENGERGPPQADHRSQSHSQLPSRANSGRRRPYPAQALPIDKLPRIEPSRENLQDDTSMQQTPALSEHSSEHHFSDKSIRSKRYPTQTLPIDSVIQPKPSREELTAELTAEDYPPAIHAVKDSETTKKRAGRTLVICLDGTGDKFDNDNSNIVHLVECLKKDDPSQVTYYQAGIGTYNASQDLSAGFSASLDMAVGSGLGVHICDAYRFLMATYREGDRICLFGFSRGAYTARCLAGMIHKVGLLPAHNGAQVPFAYAMYKDDTPNGWEMSAQFKNVFCNDVRVYFIGVFDSVASVGFIPRKLPLSSNPACQAGYFRHAVALDEHRAKFKCARFQKSAQSAVDQGLVKKTNNDPDTDVLEVYFAGCHADVGGGAVNNSERHMLSRIPLRWMIRQSFECDTGILFHSAALAEKGLDVHTLSPRYTPLTRPSVGPPPSLMNKYEEGSLEPLSRRSTGLGRNSSITSNPFADDTRSQPQQCADMIPEQVEDYFDSMSRINDQLIDAYWSWFILELWPVKVRTQDQHGNWTKKIRPNLSRYRHVPERQPLLHWTVRQRMETLGYRMKVRTAKDVAWKVVV